MAEVLHLMDALPQIRMIQCLQTGQTSAGSRVQNGHEEAYSSFWRCTACSDFVHQRMLHRPLSLICKVDGIHLQAQSRVNPLPQHTQAQPDYSQHAKHSDRKLCRLDVHSTEPTCDTHQTVQEVQMVVSRCLPSSVALSVLRCTSATCVCTLCYHPCKRDGSLSA